MINEDISGRKVPKIVIRVKICELKLESGIGTFFLLFWEKVVLVPVNHAFRDEELHPLGDAVRKLVQVF